MYDNRTALSWSCSSKLCGLLLTGISIEVAYFMVHRDIQVCGLLFYSSISLLAWQQRAEGIQNFHTVLLIESHKTILG